MDDNSFINSSIKIEPILNTNGIYYVGQYGTSGYASAAKGYLYNFYVNDIPITWEPLYFDNSSLENNDQYNIIVKSLINKHIPSYDIVILHSTPDLWPSYRANHRNVCDGKFVVGYCTWETNKLPPMWVECINKTVNEVWCPSNYNKTAFIKSGVTIPIQVVPHIFLPKVLPNKEKIKLIDNNNGGIISSNTKYTFYSIGELHIRKGIEDTIEAFCKSFSTNDPVRLLLKIHYRDYSIKNVEYCKKIINSELSKYPNHPSIICLFNNLSANEMLALHSLGDCYVSLNKGEGFGLTVFDAFNYGRKIITTGYGGPIDFLGLNYPGLVNYNLGPVKNMTGFSGNYTEDQEWAYPSVDHTIELMKKL